MEIIAVSKVSQNGRICIGVLGMETIGVKPGDKVAVIRRDEMICVENALQKA